MKQFLLAAVLIAVPVALFAAVETWVLPQTGTDAATADALGDLSGYETIVSDTRDLVDQGNLAAAKTRISDFETTWDQAEPTLRPKAPAAWGNIDASADKVFAALRAASPDPETVQDRLSTLSSTLASPGGDGGSAGGMTRVSGVAVTDANGHPLPCEAMLDDLRSALSQSPVTGKDKSRATDLRTRATERCNADDDTHADDFAAQALAIVRQ